MSISVGGNAESTPTNENLTMRNGHTFQSHSDSSRRFSIKRPSTRKPTDNQPGSGPGAIRRQTGRLVQWKKRREGKLGAGTFVELTLTSQTWRDIVWKHQLFIYRPSNVESTVASPADDRRRIVERFARTAAGAGNDKMPGEATVVATLAEIMRAPVAVLMQVPEQPLFGGKKEDEIFPTRSTST